MSLSISDYLLSIKAQCTNIARYVELLKVDPFYGKIIGLKSREN